MSDFDFQDYLSAIALHYGQQRDLYTLTDALLPLEAQSVEREEEGRERRVEQFPVLAGLRKYALGDEREHVLLAGRPGSGKSTALRQLVVELAADGLVPVLVQLKGDRTVPELIKAEFRRAKVPVTDEQIEDWLVADRLILLLDGVNEMPTEELRRSLAQFREDNRTVPMIFTTRDLSLGGDLGIGKRLEMKPLSEGQLREFVGKYLPEQGEKLLGQLRDRLREIAETPLLLKMLCDVFGQTGEIPPNKGELFRLFDREYEKFKSLPAVSADFRRFKSEILQHLAFVMMQGDESKPTEFWLTIARSQAERSIEQWLTGRVSDPGGKAKEWLEDLLEHHLLQVAADGRRVEFHHQLFQEYYAAEWLLGMFADRHPDVVEPERFQHFYLNYLKWTESVAIVLSLMEDEETAVDLVQQALDVDLMLGARLAGEARCVFQEETIGLIDTLEVPDWLKVKMWRETRSDAIELRMAGYLRYDMDTWHHLNAAEALASINSPTSLEILISEFQRNYSNGLLGKSNYAAFLATLLLKKFHKKEKILEFFANILQHREPQENSKYAMPGSTEEAISTELIPLLIEQLDNDDPLVRKNSDTLLKEIQLENIVPGLVRSLNHQKHDVRWRAARALKGISKEKVFSILDSCGGIHFEFINQLIDIFPECFSKQDESLILEMLDKTHAVVYTRKESSKVTVSCHFIRLILDEIKNSVKEEISAHIYKEIDSGNILLILLDSLNGNIIHHSQIYIIQALGLLGDKGAIPGLIKSLKTEDGDIRFCAAEALGRLCNNEGVPILIQALESSDGVRRQCFEAIDYTIRASHILGKLKSKAAIPRLINLLDNSDSSVRRSAIFSLGEIDPTSVISRLFKLLRDSDFSVRKSASIVLSRVDSEVVTSKFLEIIEDSDWSNNFDVTALANIKGNRAAHILPNLLTLFPNPSGEEAFSAIQGIQANCKFYNYKIFHSPPAKPQPTQPDTLATIATTVDTIDQRTKQMADQPARIFNLHDKAQYFEKVEGGYHEHNYAPQANLKETEQLTQLLQKLRTSNPNATEEQIFDILLRGFQTMPQNNPQNWQNWQNILSLVFVGGVEGIKIVCPPAGIPIEVGRKLYDIYDRNRKQLPGA
jgi:HEAT repeat protein